MPKRTPAYRVISDSLRTRILKGKLAPGELLLPENDLAKNLGVTRPTIREALRTLENSGLVERGPRRRMRVTPPSPQVVHDAMRHAIVLHEISFRELWEILMALEPTASDLAASRVTPEILEKIEENLIQTEACLNDPTALATIDVDFHNLVTEATGNAALALAREAVADFIFPAYCSVSRKVGPGERLLKAHREIFKALEAGDSARAREWMSKHVQDFRRGCKVAGINLEDPVTMTHFS